MHRRHPISNHWTIDWDVATSIEALEELYPLQVEHKHLDFASRWQQVIDRSVSRIRIESDNMAQVQRDTIQEWNNGSTTIGPIGDGSRGKSRDEHQGIDGPFGS